MSSSTIFPQMPLTMELSIIVIAILYSMLTIFLQRKLSNPKKMRELQRKSKNLSKELNELVKSNAPHEKISEKQKELMPILSETMKVQFKSMIVVLPIFAIIYYVMLPHFFSTTLYVKFIGELNYTTLFFITVLLIGVTASVAILLYDKKKAAEEERVPEAPKKA